MRLLPLYLVCGFKPPDAVWQREKINQREQDQTIASTSFLWSPYYPNRYFFEVNFVRVSYYRAFPRVFDAHTIRTWLLKTYHRGREVFARFTETGVRPIPGGQLSTKTQNAGRRATQAHFFLCSYFGVWSRRGYVYEFHSSMHCVVCHRVIRG